MRLVLIGPGSIDKHVLLIGMTEDECKKQIKEIARKIAGHEIVLLPDKGICMEIAKECKMLLGKKQKIIGTVPIKDKDFGIKHLEQYMDLTVLYDGKEIKIFDKFIDTKDWYRQDMQIGLFGHAIIYLGITLGTMGELSYAYYLYKLSKGKKEGLKISLKKLHPEIVADETDAFITYIYEPFVPEGLPKELEFYIHDSGGDIKSLKSISKPV